MPFDNYYWVKWLLPQYWKQDEPDAAGGMKYHPQFGFEDHEFNREAKTPSATWDEMDAAGIESHLRDECAYWTIRWRGCVRSNLPFFYKCNGIKNELNHCYLKEKIDDMKEFERERRLNRRERLLAEGTR